MSLLNYLQIYIDADDTAAEMKMENFNNKVANREKKIA